jgi:uncharacterized protein (TIGR02246 family)
MKIQTRWSPQRKSQCFKPIALWAAAMVAFVASSAASAEKEKSPNGADEAAIRASAKTFTEGFARGDAKALAAMWTENGTLADEQGQIFKGRKEIEEQYAALFKAEPKARMEIAVQSIEFPMENTAVEDGIARMISKQGAQPAASRYTAVHVREDGKWLMAAVRESTIELPSSYAALKDFEWLVGNWEVKADSTTVENKFHWIANRSFLEREYSVRQDGMTTSSGVQIIGWDPRAGQIRSWSFDSAGGHGTGLWSAVSDGWQIESLGVLPDGAATTSLDRLIRASGENDVFGWKSSERRVGDERLPDLPEVVLDRVKEKKH